MLEPTKSNVSIVSALGGRPRFHKAEVMTQTQALLAVETAERHRRVVLVIELCTRARRALVWTELNTHLQRGTTPFATAVPPRFNAVDH